ncbi:MAG: hypothetical protein ABIJ75_00015 [Actinomycetota bacterium]
MTEPDKTLATTSGDVDLATAPLTYKTLQAIADTEFIPKEMRGKVPVILACVLAGRELGLGPMESLQKIDVIDGRPAPSAELLVAMVFRAGHRIYPKEITPTTATAKGERMGPDGKTITFEFTFTMKDAERAGLASKFSFKHYPGPMLYWRAASQLVRIFFPDVVTAMKAYTPDELGSEEWVAEPYSGATTDIEEAEVVDPTQAGPGISSPTLPTGPAMTSSDESGRPFEEVPDEG